MSKKKKIHHRVVHHLSLYLESPLFYPLLSVVSLLSLFVTVISMGAVNVALVILRPKSWPWVAAAIAIGSGLGSALIAYLIQYYSLLMFDTFMDQSQLGIWALWIRSLLANGNFLEWLFLAMLPLVPLTPIVVLLAYAKVSPFLIFAVVFLGRWIKYSLIGASLMVSHFSEWLKTRF